MFRYYVYELIDPRDGSVFYVGKGTGNRIDAHDREAASGVSSKKCNKIRKIQAAGLSVVKRKVAFFREEQDAYDFEDALIAEHGKERLTNVAPLKNEPPQTRNPFLSAAYMQMLAFGLRNKAVDYSGRPFAASLRKAFDQRFPQILENAVRALGFEAVRDGVRPFGVILENGGEIA